MKLTKYQIETRHVLLNIFGGSKDIYLICKNRKIISYVDISFQVEAGFSSIAVIIMKIV